MGRLQGMILEPPCEYQGDTKNHYQRQSARSNNLEEHVTVWTIILIFIKQEQNDDNSNKSSELYIWKSVSHIGDFQMFLSNNSKPWISMPLILGVPWWCKSSRGYDITQHESQSDMNHNYTCIFIFFLDFFFKLYFLIHITV